MNIGKIMGTVVASQKDEGLTGLKLQLVEVLDSKLVSKGQCVVAIDSIGAGIGEIVLYAAGSSARQTPLTKDRPVDAVIMAIVDEITIREETIYKKASS